MKTKEQSLSEIVSAVTGTSYGRDTEEAHIQRIANSLSNVTKDSGKSIIEMLSSGNIEYATNEEIDALFDEGGGGGSSSSSSGGGEYPEDAMIVLSGYPDSQGGEITYKDVEDYGFADFLDQLRMGSNYPPIYGYTDDYVKYTIDVFDYDEDAGELVIVLNNGDHVSMHESLNTWEID